MSDIERSRIGRNAMLALAVFVSAITILADHRRLGGDVIIGLLYIDALVLLFAAHSAADYRKAKHR